MSPIDPGHAEDVAAATAEVFMADLWPRLPALTPAECRQRVADMVRTAVHAYVTFSPALRPASPYLDVRQAATYCRCAIQTIYNNRKSISRMPGVRKLLFTRAALDQWLARRPKRR